jgi:hypothetical protein
MPDNVQPAPLYHTNPAPGNLGGGGPTGSGYMPSTQHSNPQASLTASIYYGNTYPVEDPVKTTRKAIEDALKEKMTKFIAQKKTEIEHSFIEADMLKG